MGKYFLVEYGWNIHDLMDVHYYFGYRSNGYLIRYTFFSIDSIWYSGNSGNKGSNEDNEILGQER